MIFLAREAAYFAAMLMGPRLAAAKCEIISIGHLATRRFFRLKNLVGDALTLAIGHGLLFRLEAKGNLLLHVGRTGPSHQRFDDARLLRFVVKLPFHGLGPPRLHGVLGGLKNSSDHEPMRPFVARTERLEPGGDNTNFTPPKSLILRPLV